MYSLDAIEGLLPLPLQDAFRSDGNTIPRVLPIINRFAEWFDNSGLPFFKNYTDHSSRHSVEVFITGVELISASSQRLISARDLGYFLVTCFCHDAGMHLTETHFQRLVDDSHQKLYSSIEVDTWPATFRKFFDEAKRLNSKTLELIFGDSKPIQELPSESADYTDRHRRLIGEFLRRFHPRLAHDLPLGLDQHLGLKELLGGFREEEKDIVGLIARSHGMPLRDTFGYIESRYDLRDYNRTHIVFLMATLRVADYLQIQATRAPISKSDLHPVVSPISQREWRVHNIIKNITKTHDDPEAVYVDARPATASDFLRLKSWLVDLQRELDTCWAIFGEVYGRQIDNGLNELKFCLRRIRSSIFEKERTFGFVAEEIYFRVAEAEMLSLLLAPLYGDNPGYGVRELLQNAVDATQERLYLLQKNEIEKQLAVIVKIVFENSGGTLTVTDQGVGMTVEILKNYFLNAGASFRSSLAWKNDFLQDDGSANIARSGRFGVGALAAFMIGDRIAVSTRHHSAEEEDGLYFEAGLHDPQLEIKRAILPIGTTIEIKSDIKKQQAIKSFCDRAGELFAFSPFLQINLVREENNNVVVNSLIRKDNFLVSGKSGKYREIGISAASNLSQPDFVNGIAVMSLNKNSQTTKIAKFQNLIIPPACANDASGGFEKMPISVHLIDNDAAAPINLARTGFTATDQDVGDFVDRRAFEEIVALLPVIARQESRKTSPVFYKATDMRFVYFKDAICPCDAFVLNAAGIKALATLYFQSETRYDLFARLPNAAFRTRIDTQELANKTSLRYRLRHIDLLSRASKAAIFAVRDELLRPLMLWQYCPKWLLALQSKFKTIDVNGVRFVFIRWGACSDTVETSLSEILGKGGVSHLEYVEASNWTSAKSHWLKLPDQTSFSKRWISAFEDTACLYPVIKSM